MKLIINKEPDELGRKLEGLLRENRSPVSHFYPETLTKDLFFQEVETLPFLSTSKCIVVHRIDQMPELIKEALICYLEKPAPWVTLYLTAHELSAQSKLLKIIEKKGEVHRFKEEKPWEKEQRLVKWLIEEAKREGCHLAGEGAVALVNGVDHATLSQELNKLVCYAGERKKIELADIKALCTPVHHETIWQLGEAIMEGKTNEALSIGKALMDDGLAIFPLLASLRTQFLTGIEILHAVERGDVQQRFAYLKGKLLEKKIQLLKRQGIEGLQRGAFLIFETEVKAKNSATDPSLLLELLTVTINDSVPTS